MFFWFGLTELIIWSCPKKTTAAQGGLSGGKSLFSEGGVCLQFDLQAMGDFTNNAAAEG
jgi:hypothetical protein